MESCCRRSFCLLPIALGLLVLPGCVTLDALVSGGGCAVGVPCQVVATWCNQVAWTPDPARGGVSSPGFAGRLYLFGPQIDVPIAGDGAVVVDLYDETAGPAGAQAVPLEQWRIDKDTLKRLLRRDAVGWGYTLFLPWGTYDPAITRVQLKVRYESAKGLPLYAQGSPITLDNEASAKPVFGAAPTGTGTNAGANGTVRPAAFNPSPRRGG